MSPFLLVKSELAPVLLHLKRLVTVTSLSMATSLAIPISLSMVLVVALALWPVPWIPPEISVPMVPAMVLLAMLVISIACCFRVGRLGLSAYFLRC